MATLTEDSETNSTTTMPTGNLEISVSRAELLRELTAAQSVVERKTTIPILSNFLFEATNDGGAGKLTITALNALTTTEVGALSTTQVKGLTTSQLNGLTATTLGSLPTK